MSIEGNPGLIQIQDIELEKADITCIARRYAEENPPPPLSFEITIPMFTDVGIPVTLFGLAKLVDSVFTSRVNGNNTNGTLPLCRIQRGFPGAHERFRLKIGFLDPDEHDTPTYGDPDNVYQHAQIAIRVAEFETNPNVRSMSYGYIERTTSDPQTGKKTVQKYSISPVADLTQMPVYENGLGELIGHFLHTAQRAIDLVVHQTQIKSYP